jgi:hypothetical protein
VIIRVMFHESLVLRLKYALYKFIQTETMPFMESLHSKYLTPPTYSQVLFGCACIYFNPHVLEWNLV